MRDRQLLADQAAAALRWRGGTASTQTPKIDQRAGVATGRRNRRPAAVRCVARPEVARAVVVDGVGGDRQHRERRQHGRTPARAGTRHAARTHKPTAPATSAIATLPAWSNAEFRPMRRASCAARVQAQGQRRDRGAEHIAGDRHQAIGDDQPARSVGHAKIDDRRDRQHRKRQHDRAALGARLVDRGADRRLHGNARAGR